MRLAIQFPSHSGNFKPAVRSPREDKIFRAPNATPDPELARQQHIYDILRAFCDRAFRRPATHDELTRLLGIVVSAERDGEPPEAAIQLALRAVLVSPQFLFLGIKTDQNSGSTSDRAPDNDFELASRLSYFLWSSMPDDELYRLAARGALRREGNLRAQVNRMLRDRRSRALAENFASQWLQTRKLKDFTPDPILFPDFDEALRMAMLEETVLFFESIRDEDRSILDLLDADYTFVNERLARHYGIPGVKGGGFRRVSVAGTQRGGILTQASVLAATSNPTRTSPVKRGKWILENILGAPPGASTIGGGSPEGRRRSRVPRSRFGRRWRGTGPSRLVPRATGGWTPSVSDSKTSTQSAAGDRSKTANRSTPRAGCRAAGPFRVRPSSRRLYCRVATRLPGA